MTYSTEGVPDEGWSTQRLRIVLLMREYSASQNDSASESSGSKDSVPTGSTGQSPAETRSSSTPTADEVPPF